VAISFSKYAHCPRCGNFDLDHIARERVGPGLLFAVQRFLGFPAYRCDPCRQKFFSLLPYRRIIPSMISSAERKIAHP
jgi:transposase-like protein